MVITESRHYSRIHFDATIELNIDQLEDIHTAHLLDISLKGALVETEMPITSFIEMHNCMMTLTFSNHCEKIIMQGKVVNHAACHIGLEALHMDIDSITSLRKLILLNTGSQELLETELNYMLNKINKKINT